METLTAQLDVSHTVKKMGDLGNERLELYRKHLGKSEFIQYK